jgi:hypothetical protein
MKDGPARVRATAAKSSAARLSLKARLQTAAERGDSTYLFPDALPVIVTQGQRTDAATINIGEFRAVGNAVYVASGFNTASTSSGTTGTGTAPSGTGIAITDGQVVWAYVGYLAPVAYANSLALYVDQLVYNGGGVFKVVTAGTTNSTGTGPTSATLTDGTVTFAYMGEQTKPLMTLNSAAASGLTQQVSWNGSQATILGGTILQSASNPRGGIASRSLDGNAYSDAGGNADGGGSVFTVTDAPSVDFTFTGGGASPNFQSMTVWSSGELVGLVTCNTNSQRYLNLDYSGVKQGRRLRTLRFMIPYAVKFAGFYATAADTFTAYTSPDPIRAVHLGDSFTGGAAGISYCLLYATKLGLSLGIDDYRVSGLGGTGVLQVNGSAVNYGTRFTQDVVSQNPGLVIIQSSGNDASGVSSALFTTAQVNAAHAALLLRVKNELPSAQAVVLSSWNNRGALSSPSSDISAGAIASAVAASVPYIDWSNYLTEGGYMGHATSTGNSLFYTSEGTHPTYWGHDYRRRRLKIAFRAVWSSIA